MSDEKETFKTWSEKSLGHLELEISLNKYPNDQTKIALAQLTGLTTDEVSEWFEANRKRLSSPRRGSQPFSPLGRPAEHTTDQHGDPPATRSQDFNVDQPISDVASQLGSPVWSPTEGKGESTEEIIPGCAVFSITSDKRKARRRKVFSADKRREVASVRRVGACDRCRRKKVACRHALVELVVEETATSPASSPSIRTANAPVSHLLETNESLAVVRPITTAQSTSVESAIAISSLPQISTRTALPTIESALNITQSHELTRSGVRTDIDSTADSAEEFAIAFRKIPQHSPIKKSTVTTQPSAETCSVCGFRPDGDPKWYKSNLARHMKARHSGTTPTFLCPAHGCGRTYRRSDNLLIHVRKAHPGLELQVSTENRNKQGARAVPEVITADMDDDMDDGDEEKMVDDRETERSSHVILDVS